MDQRLTIENKIEAALRRVLDGHADGVILNEAYAAVRRVMLKERMAPGQTARRAATKRAWAALVRPMQARVKDAQVSIARLTERRAAAPEHQHADIDACIEVRERYIRMCQRMEGFFQKLKAPALLAGKTPSVWLREHASDPALAHVRNNGALWHDWLPLETVRDVNAAFDKSAILMRDMVAAGKHTPQRAFTPFPLSSAVAVARCAIDATHDARLARMLALFNAIVVDTAAPSPALPPPVQKHQSILHLCAKDIVDKLSTWPRSQTLPINPWALVPTGVRQSMMEVLGPDMTPKQALMPACRSAEGTGGF
jgi:hypothetical protein